jgi:hypothetical protein
VHRMAPPVPYVYPGRPFAFSTPNMFMYRHSGVALPPGYPMPHVHAQSAIASSMARTGAPAWYAQGLPFNHPEMQPVMVEHISNGPPMATRPLLSPWRVVVHNLPWELDDNDLLKAFSDWNPLAANIAKDYKTGHSKCVKYCSGYEQPMIFST